MTIEEAKTNLECLAQDETAELEDDEREAIQLGIEALKRVRDKRSMANYTYSYLLPGETEE